MPVAPSCQISVTSASPPTKACDAIGCARIEPAIARTMSNWYGNSGTLPAARAASRASRALVVDQHDAVGLALWFENRQMGRDPDIEFALRLGYVERVPGRAPQDLAAHSSASSQAPDADNARIAW
jgi:hypothetical protein